MGNAGGNPGGADRTRNDPIYGRQVAPQYVQVSTYTEDWKQVSVLQGENDALKDHIKELEEKNAYLFGSPKLEEKDLEGIKTELKNLEEFKGLPAVVQQINNTYIKCEEVQKNGASQHLTERLLDKTEENRVDRALNEQAKKYEVTDLGRGSVVYFGTFYGHDNNNNKSRRKASNKEGVAMDWDGVFKFTLKQGDILVPSGPMRKGPSGDYLPIKKINDAKLADWCERQQKKDEVIGHNLLKTGLQATLKHRDGRKVVVASNGRDISLQAKPMEDSQFQIIKDSELFIISGLPGLEDMNFKELQQQTYLKTSDDKFVVVDRHGKGLETSVSGSNPPEDALMVDKYGTGGPGADLKWEDVFGKDSKWPDYKDFVGFVKRADVDARENEEGFLQEVSSDVVRLSRDTFAFVPVMYAITHNMPTQPFYGARAMLRLGAFVLMMMVAKIQIFALGLAVQKGSYVSYATPDVLVAQVGASMFMLFTVFPDIRGSLCILEFSVSDLFNIFHRRNKDENAEIDRKYIYNSILKLFAGLVAMLGQLLVQAMVIYQGGMLVARQNTIPDAILRATSMTFIGGISAIFMAAIEGLSGFVEDQTPPGWLSFQKDRDPNYSWKIRTHFNNAQKICYFTNIGRFVFIFVFILALYPMSIMIPAEHLFEVAPGGHCPHKHTPIVSRSLCTTYATYAKETYPQFAISDVSDCPSKHFCQCSFVSFNVFHSYFGDPKEGNSCRQRTGGVYSDLEPTDFLRMKDDGVCPGDSRHKEWRIQLFSKDEIFFCKVADSSFKVEKTPQEKKDEAEKLAEKEITETTADVKKGVECIPVKNGENGFVEKFQVMIDGTGPKWEINYIVSKNKTTICLKDKLTKAHDKKTEVKQLGPATPKPTLPPTPELVPYKDFKDLEKKVKQLKFEESGVRYAQLVKLNNTINSRFAAMGKWTEDADRTIMFRLAALARLLDHEITGGNISDLNTTRMADIPGLIDEVSRDARREEIKRKGNSTFDPLPPSGPEHKFEKGTEPAPKPPGDLPDTISNTVISGAMDVGAPVPTPAPAPSPASPITTAAPSGAGIKAVARKYSKAVPDQQGSPLVTQLFTPWVLFVVTSGIALLFAARNIRRRTMANSRSVAATTRVPDSYAMLGPDTELGSVEPMMNQLVNLDDDSNGRGVLGDRQEEPEIFAERFAIQFTNPELGQLETPRTVRAQAKI
jgi:hypothetical protein